MDIKAYERMLEGLRERLGDRFSAKHPDTVFYVSTNGVEPKLRLGVTYFDGPAQEDVEEVLTDYVSLRSGILTGLVNRMPSDSVLKRAEDIWREARRRAGLNDKISLFTHYGQGFQPALVIGNLEIEEHFPNMQVIQIARQIVFQQL